MWMLLAAALVGGKIVAATADPHLYYSAVSCQEAVKGLSWKKKYRGKPLRIAFTCKRVDKYDI